MKNHYSMMRRTWLKGASATATLGLLGCSTGTSAAPSGEVDVLGSTMFFRETGAGRPVLFLHGNPTSSYMWRNVMGSVGPGWRAIAVDLIGMGQSGKPAIAYSFEDHRRYLDAFIEEMGLENLVLVGHDWGAGLALDYARRNESRVSGVVFGDTFVRTYSSFADLGMQGAQIEIFGGPAGEALVLDDNIFIEALLPMLVARGLTEEELNAYRAPFPTRESRRPILQWVRSWPVGGMPADAFQAVTDYAAWLRTSTMPKRIIYNVQGDGTTGQLGRADLDRLVAESPNLDAVEIARGGHFIAEDHPEAYAASVASFLARLG